MKKSKLVWTDTEIMPEKESRVSQERTSAGWGIRISQEEFMS